jgi:lipoprotein-releasing system ATP-binding protein
MSDTRQLKPEQATRGEGQGPHFVAHGAREASTIAAPAPAQMAAVNLWKRYHKGRVEIPVLRGVNLEVHRGEFMSIIGQSGSGKSTLLHLLGTLDAPDEGEIHFDGKRIDNVSVSRRDRFRNQKLGMIFQFYHLLPELTALENVLAPMLIAQGAWGYFRQRREFVERAKHLLDLVGLLHRMSHRPRELSGGEMQRTAIARALVAGPEVLLADEPTGNLDSSTGEEILRTLRTLNQAQNLTIVMVTHDRAIAAQADRTVRLAQGQVEVV